MKKYLTLILLLALCCCNNSEQIAGKWNLTFNNGVDITKDSKHICKGLYASFNYCDSVVTSKNYSKHKITTEKINDSFGNGYLYKIVYTNKNIPKLTQNFYIYPERDYLLTDFTVESKDSVASNYMAAVNIKNINNLLEKGDNRALFIPFDNDKWIRYESHPLTFQELTSYEVTSVFNNDNRNGLVVGSVEHDNWKTAVTMKQETPENISLVCYGGIASELTRDVNPHGELRGIKIKSPKILLGFFDNWCDGLEEFAKANALVNPPKEWNKAVPFGWNSWGALQFNLTYEKAMEVSDFIKENLQSNGFTNPDNTVYVGLDSGWNVFSEEQLKAFVEKCKSNGQIAGVYWTPFTDWGKRPGRTIDAAPEYKYKDVYLYANGKPQELDGAYALDPTHPAVSAMMKQTSELFKRAGFEYVKMDFMTHGAMEADSWYLKEIQTGMQGYNFGMELLNKYFGNMYINLSISPIFPAHYAQSRRIACDAWNKIKDTEYTLNALSYGWWQKYIYQYNDADHIVLRDATDGENRARVTSGIITGIFISGDNFSAAGNKEGKDKSVKYLTNELVNSVATGEVFRPVEGNGEKSENIFIRHSNNKFYCAIFNYSEEDQTTTLSLTRLGLDKDKKYNIKELWSGEQSQELTVHVPSKDVKLLEFTE